MKRLLFLHHQRCGGTTLRRRFVPFSVGYYPGNREELTKRIFEKLEVVPSIRIVEIEPGYYIDQLVDDFHYFTTLREPIDRAMSWIELHTRTADKESQARQFRVTETDEERLNPEFWVKFKRKIDDNYVARFNVLNYYTKIAPIRTPGSMHMRREATTEDYDTLIEAFQTMSFLVYNKETYTDDLTYFGQRFDIPPLVQNIDNVKNVMKGNSEFVESCPAWFTDYLMENNMLDRQFWSVVRVTPTTNNLYVRPTYYD